MQSKEVSAPLNNYFMDNTVCLVIYLVWFSNTEILCFFVLCFNFWFKIALAKIYKHMIFLIVL